MIQVFTSRTDKFQNTSHVIIPIPIFMLCTLFHVISFKLSILHQKQTFKAM